MTDFKMVPLAGLEPAHSQGIADFESAASTNFTTGACYMVIFLSLTF